jgi:2-oxoisovalerate dehydrogenase E1 component
MEVNQRIFFIGEDVRSPYGGAFKISKDLSDLFPERVLNTPISEAAIVGLANGLALEGYLPIVEIMFGDFISLAFDQIINHAAKFRYMYNNQVRVPLIIRTPMGGGRGYGPTHSQNLDRHLLGIPGIRLLALNNLVHPKTIYETLINSSEDPAIVLESKVLYTKNVRTHPPSGFIYRFINESCPMIVVEPQASRPDLTIIAYGGLSDLIVEIIEELFLEHELIVQYLCPIQIYPFDVQACQPFISLSNYLVLVEEGQGFANFSAEFLAQYGSLYPHHALTSRRISADASPIPSCKFIENEVLVSKEKIITSIFELIRGST